MSEAAKSHFPQKQREVGTQQMQGTYLALKADFQYHAIVADEPPILRVGESNGPIAAHFGHLEPGLAFVGSPCSLAQVVIRLHLGCDHNRAGIFSVAIVISNIEPVGVGERKDCTS